jgi:ABC-type lipoprotein export system ATPase subunit
MSENQEVVIVQNLQKRYVLGNTEIPVLRDISLAIKRGEMVAVMGASGSGKTTLMNILGCMDRPSAGKYWLDGMEISELSNDSLASIRNQKIGFVFQNFNLLPRMSALENVAMPILYSLNTVTERMALQRAKGLLEKVGLGERLQHEPSQLSGGQQQRVAIARSLANNPELLLADEPTGNLDSHTSVDILEMFRSVNRSDGITIILITHDPDVVIYADRVIFIRDGRIETPTKEIDRSRGTIFKGGGDG